ncbi:hypothetical protein GEMRC1_001025 [Eukaryota sp. GEM-RC1]
MGHTHFIDRTGDLRHHLPTSESTSSPDFDALASHIDLSPFVSLWNDLNNILQPSEVTSCTSTIKSTYVKAKQSFPQFSTLYDGILACLTAKASSSSQRALKHCQTFHSTQPLSAVVDPQLFDTLRSRLQKYDDEESPSPSTTSRPQLLSQKIAVEREVFSLSADVHQLERMVNEVVTLNGFISEQVSKQYEDVISIQKDVLDAESNVEEGVGILDRSLDLMRKTKLRPFFIFIIASVVLWILHSINP